MKSQFKIAAIGAGLMIAAAPQAMAQGAQGVQVYGQVRMTVNSIETGSASKRNRES